jgi:predicted nucleotidyltransferase
MPRGWTKIGLLRTEASSTHPRMIRRAPLPADIRHRLPRLAEVFRDDVQVAAVYLFGSFARGTEGPLSDVDIAILLEPGIDRARLAALTLRYTEAVLATLGTDEVSVVMLDTAPLPLRYRARSCSPSSGPNRSTRSSGPPSR